MVRFQISRILDFDPIRHGLRPFFTRDFFQELFGLEESKHFLEKFRQVHN